MYKILGLHDDKPTASLSAAIWVVAWMAILLNIVNAIANLQQQQYVRIYWIQFISKTIVHKRYLV